MWEPTGVLTLSILLLMAEDCLVAWAYSLDDVKIVLSPGCEPSMEALHRLFERFFPHLKEFILRFVIESAVNSRNLAGQSLPVSWVPQLCHIVVHFVFWSTEDLEKFACIFCIVAMAQDNTRTVGDNKREVKTCFQDIEWKKEPYCRLVTTKIILISVLNPAVRKGL